MYAEVVLSKVTPQLDKIYHYKVPSGLRLEVGHQVIIPFGKRSTIGYVVGFAEKSDLPDDLIKEIIELKSPLPLFHPPALKLAKWLSEYYFSFFITALRTIMPPGLTQQEKRKKKQVLIVPSLPRAEARGSKPKEGLKLTAHQQIAYDQIIASIDQKKNETFLLYGVTGSGKTEVYLQTIAHALKKGLSSIILVPEISLTPQMIRIFKDRFGDHIALYHSDLTIKERNEEWERIARGDAKIVLGTRSAIFTPVKDLGLVVLDEEYETTYKQEKSPRYHAREVALQLGVTVVLGSATPSIETFYNAQSGKYKLLELPERIEKRPLPEVEIVDMRRESFRLLSQKLQEGIKAALSKGQKVILFINRRGYYTVSTCQECGHTVNCPRCSVALVYHEQDKKLRCGHCGFSSPAQVVCPNCHNSTLGFFGIGTQRIEKEVADIYPEAKIVRLDRDAMNEKGSGERIFAAFSEGPANVLIGTQLVTKGLDLADVTLVGVVSADTALNLPDFRAAEFTFQQLTQVAGRAGRHHLPGKVIIQTLNPDHYAIQPVLDHDYLSFYNAEIKFRKELNYPPFSRIINLVFSGKIEAQVKAAAEYFAEELKSPYLGPAPCPLARIRGQFRYQIVIKDAKVEELKRALRKINPRVAIDVDPMSLL